VKRFQTFFVRTRGLGLNFQRSFERFRRDIRLKYNFAAKTGTFSNSLYVKNESWNPKPADTEVEYAVNQFERTTKQAVKQCPTKVKLNLKKKSYPEGQVKIATNLRHVVVMLDALFAWGSV
jgi:hypothetical protein